MSTRAVSRAAGVLGRFVRMALVSAVVMLPIAVQQGIERTSFEDRLGTFPVEVSLSHNGFSTLDTGLIGKLYWQRTGVAGFGASLRSTGPPASGGTLTSYVESDFLQANAAFIDNPEQVADAYGEALREELVERILAIEAVAAVAGGILGAWLFGPQRGSPRSRRQQQVMRIGTGLLAVTVSSLLAVGLFARWSGNQPVGERFDMPGIDRLSFSSPQTREAAQQVQPFLEKNNDRIAERAAAYQEAAVDSMEVALAVDGDGLEPREGEVVVLAEADPQGSQVATRVRAALYPLLLQALGQDGDEGPVVLRTIAGDITSNGAVSESVFVEREVAALPEVPVVAAKGDHDSEVTVEQLRSQGAEVPDREVVEAGGLRVAAGADPTFKSLFGGLITNPSGRSQEEMGAELREVVDRELDERPFEEAGGIHVVVHQPRAVAGYLDIPGTTGLDEGGLTTPYDDGVADVPPGTVRLGHLHDVDGPWVLWNTDGDEVTWTVVSQLGTSGGVEERPTFNRFSTPFSVPLKDVTLQLDYLNPETGLQTGYARVVVDVAGQVSIEDRVDVGLPGGVPGSANPLLR